MREPHADSWTQLADKMHVKSWKASVSNILAYFQARVEGSWIEERHCSLVFHHGSAEDRQAAARSSAECAGNINDACANLDVHAIPVEGALIVETTHTNKASAAALVWKWFMANADKNEDVIRPDFLLVIGDNRDDEPVFRWANKLHSAKAVDYAMTVTLGSRSTEAKATLTQGVTGKFGMIFYVISNVQLANSLQAFFLVCNNWQRNRAKLNCRCEIDLLSNLIYFEFPEHEHAKTNT